MKKKTARIPTIQRVFYIRADLLFQLDSVIDEQPTSRSKWINEAIEEKLGREVDPCPKKET